MVQLSIGFKKGLETTDWVLCSIKIATFFFAALVKFFPIRQRLWTIQFQRNHRQCLCICVVCSCASGMCPVHTETLHALWRQGNFFRFSSNDTVWKDETKVFFFEWDKEKTPERQCAQKKGNWNSQKALDVVMPLSDQMNFNHVRHKQSGKALVALHLYIFFITNDVTMKDKKSPCKMRLQLFHVVTHQKHICRKVCRCLCVGWRFNRNWAILHTDCSVVPIYYLFIVISWMYHVLSVHSSAAAQQQPSNRSLFAYAFYIPITICIAMFVCTFLSFYPVFGFYIYVNWTSQRAKAGFIRKLCSWLLLAVMLLQPLPLRLLPLLSLFIPMLILPPLAWNYLYASQTQCESCSIISHYAN